MARGVTINGINVAASGASVNFQKNLIAEQAMGLGGEPKIYSSGGVATGTVEAAYRPILQPIAQAINSCIAEGTDLPGMTGNLLISDEKGSISFSSHMVNSFELSMSAKDYGKCTIGYVATNATMGASSGTAGDYTTSDIPVFYSCNVGSNILTGFTIKIEIPIDTDYFVLGSSDLQELIQNGNGTVSGSLKFGPGSTDILSVSNFTATFTGGSVTLTNMAVSDVSMSGQGRQRFERSVNFRAPCNSTTNHQIFKTS